MITLTIGTLIAILTLVAGVLGAGGKILWNLAQVLKGLTDAVNKLSGLDARVLVIETRLSIEDKDLE